MQINDYVKYKDISWTSEFRFITPKFHTLNSDGSI